MSKCAYTCVCACVRVLRVRGVRESVCSCVSACAPVGKLLSPTRLCLIAPNGCVYTMPATACVGRCRERLEELSRVRVEAETARQRAEAAERRAKALQAQAEAALRR